MFVSFFHFPLKKQDYPKQSSFFRQAQPLFTGKHEAPSDRYSPSLIAKQSVTIKNIIDTKSPGAMLIDFLKRNHYRATCAWFALEANKILPPNEQFKIGSRSTEKAVGRILKAEAQKRNGGNPAWLQYFLPYEDSDIEASKNQETQLAPAAVPAIKQELEPESLSRPPKKIKVSVDAKPSNIIINQEALAKLAASQDCTTDELCQQLRTDLAELAKKAEQTALDKDTPQKRRSEYRAIANDLKEEDVQQLIQDMIGVSIGLKDSLPQFNTRYKRTAFDPKKGQQRLKPLLTYFNNQMAVKYGKLGAQRNWGNPEPQEHLEKFLEKYLGNFDRSIDAFYKEFIEENHLTKEQFPIHRVYKYTEKNPNTLGMQGAGQLQPGSRRGPFIQYAESLNDPSCNTHYKLVARYSQDEDIDISWASASRWTKWDPAQERWLRTVDVTEPED